LALTLVGFAAVMLTTRDLLDAIVLFILFGLLMAVTWGRLQAVDIALAEAAIGAGITGAMFLNARGDLERDGPLDDPRARRSTRAAAGLVSAAVLGLLLGAIMSAPDEAPGMHEHASAAIGVSGVENPVTAVLLNFRAYDTLLELAVLVVAVIGVWAQHLPRTRVTTTPVGPVLQEASRLVLPLSALIGGYLLWRGAHAPGGAFQAGSVLAAAGVLLLLIEHPLPTRGFWVLRIGLVVGVLFLIGVGLSSWREQESFLFYRGTSAQRSIVAMEVVATISITVALIALFAGRGPRFSKTET
jgi:multisubunit Na+/H+ antiporter MnhB subunit